jgi:hypothetical protein
VAWIAAWALAVLAGMTSLWSHAFTPGAAGQAPFGWPEASALRREPGRFTLVVFAHPHCPCVQATIAEVAHLQQLHIDRVQYIVVVIRTKGRTVDWSRPFVDRVQQTLPGITIVDDVALREAARFGARTSGEVLLFRPSGELAFHGGVTAARGHVGPSLGAARIQNILDGGDNQPPSPVFGCPLRMSQDGD